VASEVEVKIPEWADKWLVFMLGFGLGVYESVRNTGLPMGPLLLIVVSLLMATGFFLAFVLWRAVCRLIARMFVVQSSPRRIRLVSNGVFFTLLALMVLQPLIFPDLIHGTMTIELPREAPAR
jgi:hypothetical protein